jgi:exonuclease III
VLSKGTAMLSAVPPLRVEWEYPGMDLELVGEGRYLALEFEQYWAVNVYVPNSGAAVCLGCLEGILRIASHVG